MNDFIPRLKLAPLNFLKVGNKQALLLKVIMLLFIAAALLGWEAKVGLVGITLQLAALGLSLLLGVRDGCQAAGAQVPVLESSLEAPHHHPPQSPILFAVRNDPSCCALTISLSRNFDGAQA